MFSIDGVDYFTVREVIESIAITRQTLWRWRRERKIPLGRRFRNRQLLFTQPEFQAIEAFANHVEPEPVNRLQLSFFETRTIR
jgi:hypothetical protein